MHFFLFLCAGQGSTFRPLNSGKKSEKGKTRRKHRKTVGGIPQHVQMELGMHCFKKIHIYLWAALFIECTSCLRQMQCCISAVAHADLCGD